MKKKTDTRADREIEHGAGLAGGDPEAMWGWGTPAGKIRAARRAEVIATGAGLRPGVKALEIGCGAGMFTEMFAAVGAEIVAVDISPQLLDRARERGLPAGRVSFANARFEEFEGEAIFDAVIGSSSLHHLELDEALGTMSRLLKPGGRISFAEPNMLNPQVFLERKLRFLFPYVSPDETAFVRWRLAAKLGDAGFEEIAVTPFDWLHPAIPGFLIGAAARTGAAFEKIPLIREFSGSVAISAKKRF